MSDLRNPAFWPNAGITAQGVLANPEILAEAFAKFFRPQPQKFGSRRASDLAGILKRMDVKVVDHKPYNEYWPTNRLADRALQYAKRAGAVRYTNGPNPRWEECSALPGLQ